MKETGVVVNLKDKVATVKVKRAAASCGCCHFDTTKDEFLEAYNTCNADINDTVCVESEIDTVSTQNFLRFGMYIAGLLAGLLLGNVLVERTGINAMKEVLPFAVAAVLVMIMHLVYTRVNRKNTANLLPVISAIINHA
ncbi:MAG: SoxR reducing system RseC family protein [Treponema sp.]|jgi:hypothetical protein|nr:SoxR reducing system RseC family protein [Treponema sp.]